MTELEGTRFIGNSRAGPTVGIISQDGTGRLPAMGWNSWNEYGCDIKDSDFIKVGELLISLGLKDVGYEYVNIDDCWSDKEKRRDPTTKEILPDEAKFPQGISHTAEVIHSLGLKLGIYSDADLKYDNCNVPTEFTDEYEYVPEGPNTDAPIGYDWGKSKTAKRYNAMRDALLKQNRTIQYSLCAWGHAHVEKWGNNTGHSWRMWGDIMPAWEGKSEWSWGLMPIVNQASFLWNATDFWGHNDWDMLEVGNGNLTIEESRSHFALWCMLKSPLIIGTRLDTIEKPILDILSNKELIAFNQDPVYGASAMPFKWGYNEDGTSDMVHPAEYWVGTSVKGLHLFMLNTQDKIVKMHVQFNSIPALRHRSNAEYLVHDMWTGKDLGRFRGKIALNVAPHDTAALRITTIHGTIASLASTLIFHAD
ncbi:hypothetical protein CHGG_07669 [Chaetomium globosum CBS 148.51]|uniref:Alpha-galactosidase n=1 Tax=Chaetomium globosum (strain ATCC 6205 / CBS 148.51 / DSM 1962 / NBRC 6347 / NRRL 1970) TaxID=306901 RepID=Q2GWI5_CHAGB|nr:uncharacterized protein CHGG_07669 [Chaetomium globosum CBS 148.51]EAQ86416.1 hypothetical protein CHGG_07669 [Chaetomium globosum CBS 148.51]